MMICEEKSKYKREEVEKREFFTVPGGKNITFERGVGQKYPILGKYTPLLFCAPSDNWSTGHYSVA